MRYPKIDFTTMEEEELMYDPIIDPKLTQKKVIDMLRSRNNEATAFWTLKSYVYNGFQDFRNEVEKGGQNHLMWVLQYIWKVNGMWHNICLDLSRYPNHISIKKKPVGKPYKERIKEDFEHIQWCVDRYYYALNHFFGQYINDEVWEIHLEWAMECVCKAYAEPLPDEFNLRTGLHIIEPDDTDLGEIRREIIEVKKFWKDWIPYKERMKR